MDVYALTYQQSAGASVFDGHAQGRLFHAVGRYVKQESLARGGASQSLASRPYIDVLR
jgi:hypothetical protein